ncbi:adenine deaminase C-terminal domain-containing protein [Aneurinibacillus terranovensis]|uniref:adenine deaminase C-terminal domain-containing protein n=1 Tax=Aneurinibacillus terranovensis TaxID=278991 RepID=UPI000418DE00|nr:adenine deaminase C-terminal domain-containing protein [Aneurinibacillus terranovensis]
MIQKPLRPLSKEGLVHLIETSRRIRPATTWIKNANVLNVYTGEIQRQHVALCRDRIAYAGSKEPLIDQNTFIIEADDYTLVPGYIEPHSHPFQFYNVKTLGEYALTRGTTTLLMDNLTFFNNLPLENVLELFDYSMELPVKIFWWARLDAQSRHPDLVNQYTVERIRTIMEHPRAIQAGELTDWVNLLAGDEVQVEGMRMAKELHLRVEGHNPGASFETLNSIAAAGVTACHEAITGDEVIQRLRLGLYAHLRHSSIRPDVPDLISQLLAKGHTAWDRIMLTTDGSTPPYLENGLVDDLLSLAMREGLEPAIAYRLATLNPAVYYGLDDEIGGIAPGRIADILFLEDIENPTPVRVMVNGKILAESGRILQPFPDGQWKKWGMKPLTIDWEASADWFSMDDPGKEIPVITMPNAVITKKSDERLPAANGKIDLRELTDYQFVAAIDKKGNRVTQGIVKGFTNMPGALASTYTASGDILVIGKDDEQMAFTVNQVINMGGGIVLTENQCTLFSLPLPLNGFMSMDPMNTLIREAKQLVALLEERGYRHLDPIYSLLFLTAFHLPSIRLAAEGIVDVKTGDVLYPSRRL